MMFKSSANARLGPHAHTAYHGPWQALGGHSYTKSDDSLVSLSLHVHLLHVRYWGNGTSLSGTVLMNKTHSNTLDDHDGMLCPNSNGAGSTRSSLMVKLAAGNYVVKVHPPKGSPRSSVGVYELSMLCNDGACPRPDDSKYQDISCPKTAPVSGSGLKAGPCTPSVFPCWRCYKNNVLNTHSSGFFTPSDFYSMYESLRRPQQPLLSIHACCCSPVHCSCMTRTHTHTR